jgi:hypothetical protein
VRGADARIVGRGTGSSWNQVLDLLGRSVADNVGGFGQSQSEREHRVDVELAAAGILPGDARLYNAGPPNG